MTNSTIARRLAALRKTHGAKALSCECGHCLTCRRREAKRRQRAAAKR